ncbi:hypothetical protein HMPREF0973_02637 [Prevotella veroralis F0319]|uniref:Uncharacterized protein n=1 Tax=Prevotella veroralis F0319 TaxID=649761 RepID=C9MSL8_9BACT|nr:hypothetical protein HMPREF0973_02637 [Prevotella veroralis F0319]
MTFHITWVVTKKKLLQRQLNKKTYLSLSGERSGSRKKEYP